ncbi:putative oxidoreductase [Halogranum amylolyticum]|uniref:Putative oxidoreductase n=1 Tax=Halogranum amylolyticum TaxID=660520 RepID=A0A1H8W5V9_9EURY|nr:DoxX family protein [Halogranum amylolyticum]SEP23034.1 putative oxidoreductase [Halogranum amylolyticum]
MVQTVSPQRLSETTTQWSLVLARLALGIPMLIAGVGKVFAIGPKPMGISGFAGFLASLGVPLPTIAAWGVGLIELVGGILLLVGLAVRLASAVIAIDMLVATILYHLPNGYPASGDGIELTLTLTLIAVALVLSGPGALSIEHALFDREDSSPDSSQSRGTDG